MTFRHFAWTSIIGTAVALSGCGDLEGPGEAGVVGSYDLQTLNGDDLPVTVAQMEDEIIKLVSMNLLIRAQFSTFEINAALTGGRGFVMTGTWVLSGSRITFDDGIGLCRKTGTASSNRITIERDCDFQATLVYRRSR